MRLWGKQKIEVNVQTPYEEVFCDQEERMRTLIAEHTAVVDRMERSVKRAEEASKTMSKAVDRALSRGKW